MTQLNDAALRDSGAAALPVLADLRPVSITDRVYDALYDAVIDLSLAPGARVSEADVAARMGVSRQPVRDAFFRLSKMGFLHMRPQRATTVTAISVDAVLQARFVRLALEVACVREAALRLSEADIDALEELLDEQAQVLAEGRRDLFYHLDDRLHREISERAGVRFAWPLIKENKGHMDRVCYLTLKQGAPSTLEDHRLIVAAIRDRDPDRAEAAMRVHLSRIVDLIDQAERENGEAFGEGPQG